MTDTVQNPPEIKEGDAASAIKDAKEKIDKDVLMGYNLLAQGKRNILCGEIPQAVNQLQEACRLLTAKYGETGNELGEVYLSYGKALLDLSRMESGVLGNALEGIDEDEESGTASSDDKVEDPENTTDDDSEEKEGETEEDEEVESEDIGDEEAETKSQEGEESSKAEPDDDISNLQLAWEMLELSKVIYSRQKEKDTQLKAAEAYLKLGEVGMETEQYDQAVEDLKKCLDLQKEHLEPESRMIAETYYQIGLACCFSGNYDESISNLKNAVNVIETKLAKLKKFVEESETGKGKEPATFDDPLSIAQKEIKDLEEILPDILAKIEDTEDESKNQDKVKQMVKENVSVDLVGTTTVGFGESSSTSEAQTASTSKKATVGDITHLVRKKVGDITHLVRKKRKPEDEPEGEESKKARQETETLGNKDEVTKKSSNDDKKQDDKSDDTKQDDKSESAASGETSKNGVEKETKPSGEGTEGKSDKTVEDSKTEEKMDTVA